MGGFQAAEGKFVGGGSVDLLAFRIANSLNVSVVKNAENAVSGFCGETDKNERVLINIGWEKSTISVHCESAVACTVLVGELKAALESSACDGEFEGEESMGDGGVVDL